MTSVELKNLLANVANDFDSKNSKKNKLIAFVGLLGDFDSFEYAINLRKFAISNNLENLDIFLIAIGNQKGKEKFCKYTGFPEKNIKVVLIITVIDGIAFSVSSIVFFALINLSKFQLFQVNLFQKSSSLKNYTLLF